MLFTLTAIIVALVVGFAGGVVGYQKSRQWCSGCGHTLTCPVCGAERQGGR